MSARRTDLGSGLVYQAKSPKRVKYGQAQSREPERLWRLLSFHEIPEWQKDNEYLRSGYRPASGSAWVSCASLSRLNNQTINTYSHLIGALVFTTLPYYFYHYEFRVHPRAQKEDLIVFTVYCLGVTVCFAFSATFHILWNHSCKVSKFCNKLDYLGILALMWGAGVPTVYYGFACNQMLRKTYWVANTFTALGCTFMTVSSRFGSPKFRHWRATFYAAFGMSSIFFVVHGLLLYGWEQQNGRMSLEWMSWMATANLLGAAIYAARIPERWVPYKFDIWGASHQLFHIAVMIAAWLHFLGLVESFHAVRSVQHSCDSDYT